MHNYFPISDFMDFVFNWFLVHWTSQSPSAAGQVVVREASFCLLVGWFLQSSGLPHCHQAGDNEVSQGLGPRWRHPRQWSHQHVEGGRHFCSSRRWWWWWRRWWWWWWRRRRWWCFGLRDIVIMLILQTFYCLQSTPCNIFLNEIAMCLFIPLAVNNFINGTNYH